MPETPDPRSVIDAAEQAAAAGDYTSAEQFLREAALLQEASLGPFHPALAETLNNLGVVCDITEKPVDAEHYFRRACAIATAVLAPDHPFVVTSRQNLEAFCAARGTAVDLPSASSIARDLAAPATGSDELPPERSSYEESRPVASRRGFGPLAIGGLIALFLAFIATATWFRSNDEVDSSPASPRVSPASPATSTTSQPVEPIAPGGPKEFRTNSGGSLGEGSKTGVTAAAPPTGRGVKAASPPPTATAKSRTTGASVPSPPVVAHAQLCRDLSPGGPRGSSRDWRCVPAGRPVGPGSLFFYTRVKSSTVTAVQHRWYRDDRLRQVVDLPIRANTLAGYRTYSRTTVDSQGAGNWRVELRTRDGALLHEERFVVR